MSFCNLKFLELSLSNCHGYFTYTYFVPMNLCSNPALKIIRILIIYLMSDISPPGRCSAPNALGRGVFEHPL